MSKVVDLESVALAPVPGVVALVEELLVRVKSGEVQGVVYGACCHPSSDMTGFHIGAGDIATLVLAMERAKLRLLEVE